MPAGKYLHPDGQRGYDHDRYWADPVRARKRVIEYRQRNLEARRAIEREKYAANAEAQRAEARAYNAAHPDRRRAAIKKWRQKNRDKVLAMQRARNARRRLDPAYRARLNELALLREARTRTNGGSFTRDEWRALIASYFGRCAYCGQIRPLEPDHVMPVVAGGTSDIDNIVPACRSCNSSKNVFPLIVFLARRAA